MTDILGKNPTIWNNQAGGFGIAKKGDPNSGSINQYNQGKADNVNIGASKDGSESMVFAGDKNDTFNLTGDWNNKGYTTSNGIGGELFTTKQGDRVLISSPIGTNITGDYNGKLGGRLTQHSNASYNQADLGTDPTKPGATISDVAPPSKKYTQNIENYTKKFGNQQGDFSEKDLSKLYGFNVTDKTQKNLDLNGNGRIDSKEATAGLAFEDNTGAKADGKISSKDINGMKSLFDQSVKGSDQEAKAKIGANKQTLTEIQQALGLK